MMGAPQKPNGMGIHATGLITEKGGDQTSRDGGLRYNNCKPRMLLVPLIAVAEIAKVLSFGARKYSEWNWAKGLSYTETMECLVRHVMKWQDGQDYDLNENGEVDENHSGLLHLAHIGCNIIFLLYFKLKGYDDKFDDRHHRRKA